MYVRNETTQEDRMFELISNININNFNWLNIFILGGYVVVTTLTSIIITLLDDTINCYTILVY